MLRRKLLAMTEGALEFHRERLAEARGNLKCHDWTLSIVNRMSNGGKVVIPAKAGVQQVGRHHVPLSQPCVLGEIMMGKSFSRACITAVAFFIVGFLCSPVAIGIWRGRYVLPVQRQQHREAHTFFYRAMVELFGGTYDPEDGHISEKPHNNILNVYEEYGERLGGMCFARLDEGSGGGFVGEAFFPSGDVFEVAVQRIEGRWHLTYFRRWNWKLLWASTLDRYDVSDKKLGHAGEYHGQPE